MLTSNNKDKCSKLRFSRKYNFRISVKIYNSLTDRTGDFQQEDICGKANPVFTDLKDYNP